MQLVTFGDDQMPQDAHLLSCGCLFEETLGPSTIRLLQLAPCCMVHSPLFGIVLSGKVVC